MNELGKRISRIRKFRKMTQAQLGVALGFNPTNASIRIAQYETGTKKPKEDVLKNLSDILDVDVHHLLPDDNEAISFIITLFWLEENRFHPVSFIPSSYEDESDGYEYKKNELGINLNDSDGNNPIYDLFTRDWIDIKNKLKSGAISYDDYFEWKLHWPGNANYDVYKSE